MPIAPRFFVFLAALAASLTLDLLFFFGARGSSASFTLELFFDRGAGGGHEPPRSASARVVRGRAAAATPARAASRRAMARAIVDASLCSTTRRAYSSAVTPAPRRLAALQVAPACAECKTAAARRTQAGCAAALANLDYGSIPTPASWLHRYATRTSSFKPSSSS